MVNYSIKLIYVRRTYLNLLSFCQSEVSNIFSCGISISLISGRKNFGQVSCRFCRCRAIFAGWEKRKEGSWKSNNLSPIKITVTFQTKKELILEKCQFVKPNTFCCCKQRKDIQFVSKLMHFKVLGTLKGLREFGTSDFQGEAERVGSLQPGEKERSKGSYT